MASVPSSSSRSPLLPLLALALAPAALAQTLASFSWTITGGSPFRTNQATVAVPLGATASARASFVQLNGEEDTESMVEELLLPSPLVTDFGSVVFIADNCTLMMYPDPASVPALAGGSGLWKRQVANWDVPDAVRGVNEESVFAGLVIFGDVAYILDSRNSALHSVQLTKFGFNYRWSTYLNATPAGTKFQEGDSSMIPEASSNLLWMPLPAPAFGPAGTNIMAQVDMATGNVNYLPIPAVPLKNAPKCVAGRVTDEGSVTTDGGNVGFLSTNCGFTVFDQTNNNVVYETTELTPQPLFNLGQHVHPLYDADTNQLYFIDFAETIVDGPGQRICCVNSLTYGNCWDTVECIIVPEFERVDEKVDFIDYRWLWLAMGLLPAGSLPGQANSVLYVSASAVEADETFLYGGLNDLASALFTFDTTTGELKSSFRMRGDQFNSAPLVVSSSVDGNSNVYISSTLGYIYCFPANAPVSGGYAWRSLDLAPIPTEDLPATTYTYLSVTQSGTILATSTAGGATWQDQKATFAVLNGVQVPPSYAANAAATTGLSPGGAAGVSIFVLVLAAGAMWVGYGRVPAFRDAVDPVLRQVGLSGGRASAARSGAGESGSLLKASGGTTSYV